MDQRDNCTVENVGNKNHGKSSGADAYESIGYTRTLDKAYRFFFRMVMSKILRIILCQVSKTMFVLVPTFYHL